MIEQALLNPVIRDLIVDKAIDFLNGLAIGKIDRISSSDFERELRSALSGIEDQINNMDGLIYQSKMIFEEIAKSMSEKSDSMCLNGVNIFGDLVICVNYNQEHGTEGRIKLEDHFVQDEIKRQFSHALEVRTQDTYTEEIEPMLEYSEPEQEFLEQSERIFSVSEIVRKSNERIRIAREED